MSVTTESSPSRRTEAPHSVTPPTGMSRQRELLLMALLIVWLGCIVWFTFAEPLAPLTGAGIGFWFLVFALLLSAPDIVSEEKPNTRIVLGILSTLFGTALVGYREFAAAARVRVFEAGDIALLVLSVVVLFMLVAARVSRSHSVSPPRIKRHEPDEEKRRKDEIEKQSWGDFGEYLFHVAIVCTEGGEKHDSPILSGSTRVRLGRYVSTLRRCGSWLR